MTVTSLVTTSGIFAFFKLSAHHIHVYVDGILQAVINLAECIKCYCVETVTCDDEDKPSTWILWLISETARLYSITSEGLVKLIKKSDDNQDIFNNLLASQAPTQRNAKPKQRATCTQRVMKIESADARIKLSNSVLSVTSQQGLVCICTLSDSLSGKQYTIFVYRSKDISCNTIGEDVDPIWTRRISAEGLQFYERDERRNAEPMVELLSAKSLASCDEKCAVLYTELFNAMFGSESALMETSVVLFCSPSGVVFFFKLKDLQTGSGESQDILCTIGQPVHSLHAFTVRGKENSMSTSLDASLLGTSQSETASVTVCFAVIGQNGKCMLSYQSNDGLVYQTLILPGPVVSVFSMDHMLYTSTPKDLHCCKLSIVQKQDEKKSFDISVSNLGYRGIVGIVGVPGSALDSVMLHCFSKQGRLYTVCADGSKSNHSTASGTEMKDLLLSISRINDDMDRTKDVISQQNDVLSQLSIASKLAALCSGNRSEKKSKARKLHKIVTVKVDVKQECFGSRREFSLVVKLTNESGSCLSSDWLMMVQVGHSLDTVGEITVSSFTRSLPFINGLRPETFEEIQIPLEGLELKIPLLTVTSFLVYKVPGTGHVSAKQTSSSTDSSNSSVKHLSTLCIPISEKKLNILDFLHVPNPLQNVPSSVTSNQQKLFSNSEMCTLEDISTEFARQRPTYQMYFPSQKEVKKKTEIHTLAIDLNNSKLPDVQKGKKGSEILKFILSLTSTGSNAKIEGSLTRLCAPGGGLLTLSVGQVQSHHTSDQNGCQLTIQGEDLGIVVLMRLALTEKLFDLTKPVCSDGVCDIREHEIRSLLHTFQSINKKLDEMDGARASIVNSDGDSVEGTYRSLYKELRNVSLLHFLGHSGQSSRQPVNISN